MKFLIAISAVALATATAAYAGPQPDQAQVSQFACDLGGDCGGDASAATQGQAQPDAAAAPAAGAPRSASVRGFTFKRTAPTPSADVATAAPAPAMSSPASGMAKSMSSHGSANLRLDFASGSSDLNDGDRNRLAALATALSSPRLVGHRLRIEGHTDSNGAAAKNLDLSRRRAQSVADYLVSSGVGRDRLDVVGYGSTQPLPGHTASDGANRRVMAVMLN
ncbi:MAG: OmpA family protein [Sphingomonadaceae bacterium]|nr:OmpA family protein [Sphingomonadaceae bacterium]